MPREPIDELHHDRAVLDADPAARQWLLALCEYGEAGGPAPAPQGAERRRPARGRPSRR
jgi:hypothetical protein